MPNKQQRKQRRQKVLSAVRSTASNLGKKALGNIGSLVKKHAKDALNQLITQGSSAIMSGGIPFPTSGMLATASPSGGMNSGIQVSAPAANGRVQKSSEPKIRSRSNGNTSVSHREYVADINVEENGFDLQFQYGVNPGNGALFPWLSQIASRYETYSFRSLKIIYEPQCGTASTGTLMLAIDYDSSDAPPTSKSQMMSYKNAVRAPLWFAACHFSSPPDLHRLKTNYILSGAAPPGTDIKTYDIGNLFVAIQSAGSNQTAGELYVEYDVDLMTPQIENDPLSVSVYQKLMAIDNVNNPMWNDAKQPNFQTLGPLPVLIVQQESNLAVTEFYVGNAGYYVVTFSLGYMNAADTTFIPANYSPGLTLPVSLMEDTVTLPTPGTPSYMAQMFTGYLQVQNPEILAFYIDFQGVEANSSAGFWMTITQVAEGAVFDINGSVVSKTANPRARLGRIRPAPPLPSPFSGLALRQASEKVPHQALWPFKAPKGASVRDNEKTVRTSPLYVRSGASPVLYSDFTRNTDN